MDDSVQVSDHRAFDDQGRAIGFDVAVYCGIAEETGD